MPLLFNEAKNPITKAPINMSAAEYFRFKLDGADFATGAIEEAKATADNVAAALGVLCDVLVEKGLIAKSDVEFIIENF